MRTKEKDVLYCGVDKDKINNAAPEVYPAMFKEFVGMIKDRYRIHKRKDVQGIPKPWTNNKIFQQYKFTNVRREHDRETKWLIEHITSNNKLSYSDKILNCVLFRLFNKHQTSEIIHQPINFKELHKNPSQFKDDLEEAKLSGQNLFTGAFFTTGMRQGIKRYLESEGVEADFSANDVMLFIDHLYQSNIVGNITNSTNQKQVYDTLNSYMGIGTFLAYQIFVDLTYIPEFPFSENEFVVAGPGCVKGLNILFKDRAGLSYEECLFWLRDRWDELIYSFNVPWDAYTLFSDLPKYDRRMNIMSLENCFCEFSKYIRVLRGEGRPRAKYKGV